MEGSNTNTEKIERERVVKQDFTDFIGEWDNEGVFFYQAFNNNIANWAIEHQRFGGPEFNPRRMTWIKPSFAWMLYRSGYGRKHGQGRILKIKIPHNTVAHLLSQCKCKHSGGGSNGRVQWDPARDIMTTDNGKEPHRCLRMRAIQIGLKGVLSEQYVQNIISIQDITTLAHAIGDAHRLFLTNRKTQTKMKDVELAMENLKIELPVERTYTPHCSNDTLVQLGMLPGTTANWVATMGIWGG